MVIMKNNLESDLQDQVKRFLKQKRVLFFRYQAQSNLNGMPDIMCLYKGIFLGLELKRPKQGKPTDLQKRKIKFINDNGGVGIFVENLDDVKTLIDVISSDSNECIIDSIDIIKVVYEKLRKYRNEQK